MSLYGCDVLIWTFVALAENYGDSGYQHFIESETELPKINCLVQSKVRIKQQATDSKH